MYYSNTFIKYTKELADPKYKPVSAAVERQLLQEYKSGSTEAFILLTQSYLRFVLFVLRNYQVPDGIDIMDVVQEGNMGLMDGLIRFDNNRYSGRVGTFCVYWIKFYILRSIKEFHETKSFFSPFTDELSSITGELDDNQTREIASTLIDTTLQGLKPREKMIVVLSYGLQAPYIAKTLQEIGSMLHLNFERVRQLRDGAIDKVRRENNYQL